MRRRGVGLTRSLLALAAATVVVGIVVLLTVHPTRIGNATIVIGVTAIVVFWALFPRAWLANWRVLTAIGLVASSPLIVGVGWYAATRPAQFDVNRIRKFGGEVYFSQDYPLFREWPIDQRAVEFLGDCFFAKPESVGLGNRRHAPLRELPLRRFADVYMSATTLGVDDLVGLSHAKSLTLSECLLDADVDCLLEKLTNLESLSLDRMHLADVRMAGLDELPKLNQLSISECRFSAVATKSLASLTALRELLIFRTILSNGESTDLTRLKRLKQLSLIETNVSTETSQLLRQSLPGCRVIYR